jgi:hypothetical protein
MVRRVADAKGSKMAAMDATIKRAAAIRRVFIKADCCRFSLMMVLAL